MDKIIDKRFERVEKALATLITSITNYNPAPALANELVAADAELSQSLEQLTTHQANYAKILTLRATSATLDNQIREIALLLADTRKELLATGSSSFPTNTNPVAYSELLLYARRISRFTQPPRRDQVAASAEAEGSATPKEPKSEPQTNGTTTPVTATNGADGQAHKESELANAASSIQPSQPSTTALPKAIQEYYDPLTGVQFLPWPADEVLRSGALASIQVLLNAGIDPATFDPEKTAELEAETKRIAEEEELQREMRVEEAKRKDAERRIEAERRASVAGPGGGRREEPKVFQLETFDDDEDDD